MKVQINYLAFFKNNDKLTSDPHSITNNFGKYFSNIGPNLVAIITPPSVKFEEYLMSPLYQPLEFRPLVSEELKEIVQTFATGKAPGFDNIPM